MQPAGIFSLHLFHLAKIPSAYSETTLSLLKLRFVGLCRQAAQAPRKLKSDSPKTKTANGKKSVSDLNPTADDASASSIPLIDDERVEEMVDLICGGKHAALARWIDHLETDVAKFEVLMSGANTVGELREIQGAAHSIKGTCLNIGATVLGSLYAKLEQDAKEGATAALKDNFAAARVVVVQSMQALREISMRPDIDSSGE
jgi:HPt (histidine-containing phosphotransfer) domain-containing protein